MPKLMVLLFSGMANVSVRVKPVLVWACTRKQIQGETKAIKRIAAMLAKIFFLLIVIEVPLVSA